MARKGKKKKRANNDSAAMSDGDDETASQFSETSTAYSVESGGNNGNAYGGGGELDSMVGGVGDEEGSDEIDVYTDVETKLAEAIELLSEKRASTRATGIASLIKILRRRVCDDGVLDKRRETLMADLLSCLRHKPKAGEAVALCKLLSLIIITFGPEEGAGEEFAADILPLLVRKAREFRKPEMSAAALRSLALGAFVVITEDSDAAKCLDLFEEVIVGSRKPAPFVSVIAALQGWGLLMSTMRTEDVFRQSVLRFAALLSHDNLDVRAAAGENIAMLFGERWKKYGSSWQNGEADNANGDDEEGGGSASAGAVLDGFEDVVEKLRELSTEYHRYRSKKDRKAQRSTFREIYGTVGSGDPPEEKVKIHGDVLQLNNWNSLKQLSAMRDALGEGFLTHLARNQLLRDIFGLGAPNFNQPREKMSKFEKRMFLSPNSEVSKTRTQERKFQRNRAESYRNHVMRGDED